MSLKRGCTEEESDTIDRQNSAFTGREVRDEEERGDRSEDTGIEKCLKGGAGYHDILLMF